MEQEPSCWYGDRAHSKISTLTICDIAARQGDSRTIDHRIHTFAPGKGVVYLR